MTMIQALIIGIVAGWLAGKYMTLQDRVKRLEEEIFDESDNMKD